MCSHYVFICIYVYMLMYMYMYVYVCMHVCVCMYACIHIYLCMYVCVCVYVCMYSVYVCIYVYVCTYIRVPDIVSGWGLELWILSVGSFILLCLVCSVYSSLYIYNFIVKYRDALAWYTLLNIKHNTTSIFTATNLNVYIK